MRTGRRIVASLLAVICLSALTYFLFGSPEKEAIKGDISGLANSENACGPWAFFVAVARQGIPMSGNKIKQDLPVTDTGVSFGDLVKYAQEHGLSTRLVTLSWDELKNAESPVILWVDGNHFLTADPREEHPDGNDMMRIYDLRLPAEWLSRAKLQERWTGECLVVHKSTSASSLTGPRIKWETCFEDFGWIDPYERRRLFKYAFENVGNEPLELSIAETGCACAKADVAPKAVAPSEKGVVTVVVDISAKTGYFSTMVLLNTNDPSLRRCTVRASGGVFHPILTSLDTIYLGEVYRDTHLEKFFYVHDRGDKTLQIEDAKAVVDKEAGDTEHIACKVKSTHIQTMSVVKNPASRYRVKLGDYLMGLILQISADAPLGPFEGRVLIETNQPGRFKSGIVTFKGVVKMDVYAEPQTVLLSRREPSARIRLKSKLKDKVEIPSSPPVLSGDAKLLVKNPGTPADSHAYEVSVAEFKDAGVQNAQIEFRLNDKSSITVPVIVYNGNQ
jgi:hypothetical protein